MLEVVRVARAGFPVRLGVFDSLSRVVVVFNPVDKNAQNSLVIYSTHRFRFGAARDKFQTDDSRMANRGRLDEGTLLNENTAQQSSGDHDDAPLAGKPQNVSMDDACTNEQCLLYQI